MSTVSRRSVLKGAGLAGLAGLAGQLPAAAHPTTTPDPASPNGKVHAAILAADPRLVAVRRLRQLRPELSGRVLTHAGPPIDWADMSGPQRGAAVAFTIWEGWAHDADQARRLLRRGHIRLETNHDHHGVGGMAGVVSPNTVVYHVVDVTSGKDAYCLNEMLAHYGTWGPIAQDELTRWSRVVMPAIGRAIPKGGLPLKPIEAEAINSGDDLHCRDLHASLAWWAALSSGVTRTSNDRVDAATGEALTGFPFVSYLGLGMAAAKATMRAAEGIRGSSVVTVMARNGTTEAIQVSSPSLAGRWFTAPATPIDFLPVAPGITPADACLDLGDSAIRETVGTGAFAGVAAPALAHDLGLTVAQAAAVTTQMARICVGRRNDLPIALLGAGPPVGVDVHQVVATGVTPVIFTAVAPKRPRANIDNFLGLGHSRFPLACFTQAAAALR
jgi:hypothetical protein